MEKFADLSESIIIAKNGLATAKRKKEIWEDDGKVLELFSLAYRLYYSQIHEYLYSISSKQSEEQTRKLCNEIKIAILPLVKEKVDNVRQNFAMKRRKLKKQVATEELDEKLLEFDNAVEKLVEIYQNYLFDFECLVAYRDLMQFALCMEHELPNDRKIITMAHENKIIDPILYTSQQMILENNIKKLFKNTPTGFFKCSHEETVVRTPNGNKQIKDIEIGDKIYSMRDNELCVEEVTWKENSMHDSITIETKGGKPLIVSPEHRLLTQSGYKTAKDITNDDYLYRQCCVLDTKNEIPDDELIFTTCMMFDGHCKVANFAFYKQDNLILKEFKDCCDRLGFDYSIYHKKNSAICKVFKNKGKVEELLSKYNLLGTLSVEKQLPQQFFTMSLRQKYKFIGLMFATDGYIPKYAKNHKGGNKMGITLASENLIYDIQALLDTCGIYSSATKVKTNLNGKQFDAWNLYIPDEYLETIYNNCYVYDKQINLEDRIKEVDKLVIKPYCNNTNYPKEVVRPFKSVRRYCNKQFARNNTFKKEIINKIYETDKSLENIIYKDFVWERVVKTTYDEKKVKMVDISVSNTHNYIANGYVSHNSYSDIIIISFLQGYNLNADCLKVVGNPKMVTKTVNGVSSMMLKRTYSKIFPFYQQYENNPEKMFKILAPRNGEMLLAHANGIDFSLLCISKETPIDGGRFKYRFYDDITNSKYKTNIDMHNKDDLAYNDQWKKRRYTEFDDCEWFTGTVYYYLDFLSRRRDENGFKIAEPLKQFKYTKYCKQHKSVFVVIPKLDYDTDLCTFPQIYSTEQARIDRSNDFATFQAMEQGLPTIPDGMPFDYSNMKVWKELPLKESEGGIRSDFTMASLDLPRTGDNNLSLIIFSKCGELYYLVDAIYQKKKIDLKLDDGRTMLDLVCDKLIARKVKHLIVENNVCANIKSQIEEKLAKSHYACKVDEVYSSMKKEDKIFNAQSDIQQFIVIPAQGIFGLASDVGKAVFEIVTWNTKAKSDDSIDTVAMFVNKFINSQKGGFAQAHSFKR